MAVSGLSFSEDLSVAPLVSTMHKTLIVNPGNYLWTKPC